MFDHSTLCLPLSAYLNHSIDSIDLAAVTYYYEGQDADGNWVRLPRTVLAEVVAQGLMQQLANDQQYAREGKMYGVLLVETSANELGVLKAFSGLLNGKRDVAGWVPSIPGHSQVALAEAQTLAILDALKQELITLQNIPERQEYDLLTQTFDTRLKQLSLQHQQHKQERQQQREKVTHLPPAAQSIALAQLDEQSRRDGIERRHLKQQREAALQPLRQIVEQADRRMQQLKQQRKTLSCQLQTQMHAAYWLLNFAGESRTLQTLGATWPTGTGDCCAPKLLHYAATHGLKPLAMAEFWWGAAAVGSRVQGEFYGACAERCQPLMGFLLSGLPAQLPLISPEDGSAALAILYQDDWLIAVNKPAGLLSVPGRYLDRQDSAISRLQQQMDDASLQPVHRLDQDTSGILLVARDAETHRRLSQQFQQRQVKKIYEALLAGTLPTDTGTIDLPLGPAQPPRQQVDWQQGKPSQTLYQVLDRTETLTRVQFIPITGRTHQLRVHAADPNGLGIPILGDRLYGSLAAASRLHLHAHKLDFQHPQTGETITLAAPTPF